MVAEAGETGIVRKGKLTGGQKASIGEVAQLNY
jgi:hypothetical protein